MFNGWQGSIKQITFLELTRYFHIDWFKIPFLGEAESIIKLGIRSQFGDMGLSTSDSILNLRSLFQTLANAD